MLIYQLKDFLNDTETNKKMTDNKKASDSKKDSKYIAIYSN